MLNTQEHIDLMQQFEREHPGRKDREDKSLWPKQRLYQDGHVNDLFLTYRRGYALAKCVLRDCPDKPVKTTLLPALESMVRAWPDQRCVCADEPEGTICHYCEARNDALITAVAVIAEEKQNH